MDKGPVFSFVFFFFFMMSALPIPLLFFLSLAANQLFGAALAVTFATILIADFRQRDLFRVCRDLAVLNLTLWLLLGFFSLIEGFATALPGILSYLLLAPYALISGFLVFYLLSRADKKPLRVLKGGVAVSTMIAVISAINGAIMHLMRLASQEAEQLIPSNGLVPMVVNTIPRFTNPHLSFLLVLALFNLPFIFYYLRKSSTRNGLWWYLVPIITYALFAGAWTLIAGLLFS